MEVPPLTHSANVLPGSDAKSCSAGSRIGGAGRPATATAQRSSCQPSFSRLPSSIGYEVKAQAKPVFNFADTEWQTYFESLSPNMIGMHEIANQSVCLQLGSHGDNLDIAHVIDHTVTFHNLSQATEFAEGKGFTVEINPNGTFNKTCDLLTRRVDAPSQPDPITYELQILSAAPGGLYDGWGCAVQTLST